MESLIYTRLSSPNQSKFYNKYISIAKQENTCSDIVIIIIIL